MQYVTPIDQSIFNLGDLATFAARDVTDAIVDFQVSLSLNQSSQISVSVVDPDFAFAKANYFQVRRDIFYRNLWFEISAVEVSRSDSIHPVYKLECRSKAVQLMKRDKKPEAYRGMAAYDFALTVSKRFGLKFVGERTTKKQAIVKGKNKNSDDSVWTVLQSLAQEQQFVCFESEGTLFFCSEKFLLGKWGDPNFDLFGGKFIPFQYPEHNQPWQKKAEDKYVLLDMPSVRRSDDDIKAADGSILVDRANGVNLRPGMTIYLGGIPDFEALYIITDVQFNEGTPEPVKVQFRLPVDPTKEKVSSSGTKTSGPTSTGSTPGSKPNPVGTPQGTSQQPAAPVKTALTSAGANAYTASALGYINYRGSNAIIIRNAVSTAVSKLNNKENLDKIIAYLQAYPNLTPGERVHAVRIYTHYALGLPASKLAIAGGLSGSALTEKINQFKTQFKVPGANPTPSKVPSGQAGVDPGQSNVVVNVPKATMPTNVITLIEGVIQAEKSYGLLRGSEVDEARKQAIAAARDIFGSIDKVSRYIFYYKKSKNRISNAVWKCIRNNKVLDLLVSDKTLQSRIPGLLR